MWALAFRIAGIVLGTASLLRLATLSGGVEFQRFFQEFLNSVSGIVELGYFLNPVGVLLNLARDEINSFGWGIPPLQEVWKTYFSLNWLLLAAFARNSNRDQTILLFWAGFCSLLVSIGLGTHLPNGGNDFFQYPMAGLLIFLAGQSAISRNWQLVQVPYVLVGALMAGAVVETPSPTGRVYAVLFAIISFLVPIWATIHRDWRVSAGGLLVFGAFMIYSAYDSPIDPHEMTLFEKFGGLTLAIVFLSCIMIIAGWMFGGTNVRERLSSPMATTGYDILSVVGLAIFIGQIMLVKGPAG